MVVATVVVMVAVVMVLSVVVVVVVLAAVVVVLAAVVVVMAMVAIMIVAMKKIVSMIAPYYPIYISIIIIYTGPAGDGVVHGGGGRGGGGVRGVSCHSGHEEDRKYDSTLLTL